MSDQNRPTAIRLDKARHKLVIPWSDGHVSEYGWDGLRDACPCAQCRGGHGDTDAASDPNVFVLTPVKGYQVTSVDVVGNYALQVTWSDGHRAGIYTWDYLRDLCPCVECRQVAGSGQ